ncbi:RES family NAD+ phosphorylase [Allopusillimonas ginsengisoli]|uniref:RES family NAD+ phosphorylase n=1 Tax=Allopusillimonas ginsengisoli TaxID=453575 RepID=UPI001020BB74|nr:RES family NAD+ phosphorylase [Allopusillimonas ginsengisoli]TEA77608.1 RES domain-containing protein [Allopusillimonas ginsengisoli]
MQGTWREPPLTSLRQADTCRLLPSRFVDEEDSVLAPLADDTDALKDLFALDNATNQRLAAERGAMPGIGIDELVFGVPNFRIINGAFTYPRPEGSRFNDGQRGAWYCAFDAETALAEIVFHKIVEYTEIDYFHDSVSYQLMLADFSGDFHDIRQARGYAKCLDPRSYVASQDLALQLLEAGSLGIVYPSVRHQTGINLACFRPALVGNVRRDAAYQLVWTGDPQPTITLKKGRKKSAGRKRPAKS